MVVEADEYDYSFLHLTPELAIVTNVDYDHPDLFPDLDAYDAAFARFVANVRPGGTLVLAADDPGCVRLLARVDFVRPDRLLTFGQTAGADWRLIDGGTGWRVFGPDGVDAAARSERARRPQRPQRDGGAGRARRPWARPGRGGGRRSAAFAGVGRRFEVEGRGRRRPRHRRLRPPSDRDSRRRCAPPASATPTGGSGPSSSRTPSPA